MLCYFGFSLVLILSEQLLLCGGQVVQFGQCANVETMKYFNLESFLGVWYEIERFPTWYEHNGNCAIKRLQYCQRRVEIEHVFVREDIKYVIQVNSTYAPGADAIFFIRENNIDPIGIPLSVISTDYINYAVIYGCRHNEKRDIKYLLAWILSRAPILTQDVLRKAYLELSSLPYANLAYLEKVEQREHMCNYHWTANVQVENVTGALSEKMLYDDDILRVLKTTNKLF